MLSRLSDSYASLEQKVQERTLALQTSEQRFSSIMAAMLDMVWSLSPDGRRLIYVSPSVLLPSAQDMLTLAMPAWQQQLFVAAEQAEPVYVRDEVTWQKLPGR